MLKALLLALLRSVLTSDEFKQAVHSAVVNSKTVQVLTEKANSYLDIAVEQYDRLGLKGILLKGYLVRLVQDLAEGDATIRRALEAGEPYLKTVLDGITPDDIATISTPVIDLVKEKALAAARQ